ncbi:MAG: 50S ribosomal protein L17 [Clostridiales bacterium]|nr:50S ribosomal protein L17 [Clostridiales bacterium]
MANDKLGRPSKERLAVLRNQVSYLLWYGRIETTVAKAKAVAAEAEKMLTLAINTYQDNVTVKKTVTVDGKKIEKEVVNDGVKKLNARRKLMSFVYDLPEMRQEKESLAAFKERTKGVNHPLIEKIFNVYAPKYAERAKEVGSFGGYTRVIKTGARRGDAAELAIVELI